MYSLCMCMYVCVCMYVYVCMYLFAPVVGTPLVLSLGTLLVPVLDILLVLGTLLVPALGTLLVPVLDILLVQDIQLVPVIDILLVLGTLLVSHITHIVQRILNLQNQLWMRVNKCVSIFNLSHILTLSFVLSPNQDVFSVEAPVCQFPNHLFVTALIDRTTWLTSWRIWSTCTGQLVMRVKESHSSSLIMRLKMRTS